MKYLSLAALVPVALASLAGCATEPSACETAAASLTGCTEDQTAAFITACEESGGAESAASFAAEDGATACAAPVTDDKSDLATAAVVGTCVASMYGIRWTVTALSPSARPLDAATKMALRPIFGNLVETVRVSYDARLPPRVVINGRELTVAPAAMTFGSSIFVLSAEKRQNASALDTLVLTVHEMTHAMQAQRAGGFYGFAVAYCRDIIASGFNYYDIGLEHEAERVETDAIHDLQTCGSFGCP